MKLIRNATVSDGENGTKQVDILFDDRILEISEDPINAPDAEILDLSGLLLIPGCIDAHVHFDDPGFTQRENFLTGTTSSAYGGITTVMDMPCTSIPPVTNLQNLERKLYAIQREAVVDFALFGGIRRNDFPIDSVRIEELSKAGVIGFKVYTISGMHSFGALSYGEIGDLLCRFPEMLFVFHAEDERIIREAEASAGDWSKVSDFSRTRPVSAEVEAVERILDAGTDVNRIHFVHISSEKAARIILNCNKDVSYETCPHYLQFTSDDLSRLKGRLKTVPPVKNESDREFLRKCVQEGKVDFITTDHAGCIWEDEKNLDDFSKVYSGIPGTELMIPYLFSEFYEKGNVPLETMIHLTSRNAAMRYGFYPNKGSMQIGTDADFTIIDLKKQFRVDEKVLHCKGKYSPFDGMVFSCSIDRTILRGETVYEKDSGITAKPGYGRFLCTGY